MRALVDLALLQVMRDSLLRRAEAVTPPLGRRQGPCGRLWTAACRKVEDGSDG